MIYLASPFTHKDKAIQRERYKLVLALTEKLIQKEWLVFSPIVYGWAMTGIATDYKSWAGFNDEMILLCDELWVLTIPGWAESRGVSHECKLARECWKTVRWIGPDGNFHLEGFKG